MLSRPRDLERVRARLTSWLMAKMPDASELAIAPFERPSAGYSNETFLFDLSYRLGDGVHRDRLLVGGPPVAEEDEEAAPTSMERVWLWVLGGLLAASVLLNLVLILRG